MKLQVQRSYQGQSPDAPKAHINWFQSCGAAAVLAVAISVVHFKCMKENP